MQARPVRFRTGLFSFVRTVRAAYFDRHARHFFRVPQCIAIRQME